MISDKDRGFLLGDGIFETLLAVNHTALWRKEHLGRMERSCRKLGIHFDELEINTRLDAMLEQIDKVPAVIRISLSRGATARGLAAEAVMPTLALSADSFDVKLIGKPITLATSQFRRNPASFSDRHKTLSYVNNVMAARDAHSKGQDDALLLNIDGFVACTSIANLILIQGIQLITPGEDDGILPGIMRRFLLDIAPNLGHDVVIRSVERNELFAADGVFACNSLRLLCPVEAVDGKTLRRADGSGLMRAILAAAKGQCGADIMECAT